ncbi:MAG: T9SS type A sorting domain-containing protein, partial [Muribaculaceae bacterium]|nr:T9SS type A sorting domain-containing protein [Muribaculaceae bacterium]
CMQIINTDNGSFRWEKSPILTSTQSPTEKNEIQVTDMLPNGSWIFVWDDRGVESTPDFKQLYINRANYDGTVGNPDDAAIESVQVSADNVLRLVSLADDKALFATNVDTESQATLAIYNIDGACVATPFSGHLQAGEQLIECALNVPAGIYLATLTTLYDVKTIKLIIK